MRKENSKELIEKQKPRAHKWRKDNPETVRGYTRKMKHKCKLILTQRIPDMGYYSKGVNGKKEWADFEFVCPDCGACKHYTKQFKGV